MALQRIKTLHFFLFPFIIILISSILFEAVKTVSYQLPIPVHYMIKFLLNFSFSFTFYN